MNERFSDRARHAMALANLEASKLNHNYLAPGHMMLGLIAEGECVATEALRLLDVDLERVRTKVAAQMERGPATGTIGVRAHTKETKDAILLAIEEALDRIEQGTYGMCRDCGEPIAEARLNAIPWTRVCITCKEKQKT